MSDADDQRSARALADIARHVAELVKIHRTMNENLVEAARDLKKFLATFDTEVIIHPLAQETIDYLAREQMTTDEFLASQEKKESDGP